MSYINIIIIGRIYQYKEIYLNLSQNVMFMSGKFTRKLIYILADILKINPWFAEIKATAY